MKLLTRRIVFLFVVLTAIAAHAALSQIGTVDFVNVNGWGPVRFRLVNSPALCSSVVSGSTSDGQISVGGTAGITADGVKAMTSALLSAKLAGKQVQIWSDPGTSTTYGCQVVAVTVL